MPRFNIAGFGDVKSTMDPLPAGEYKVQITSVKDGVGKDKGTKYLQWVLTVMDHVEHSGRNLFFMTMLEPKDALFKLKGLCEAVGTGWDSNGLDTDQIVGQVVKAKVVQVTYKGTIKNEVASVTKA